MKPSFSSFSIAFSGVPPLPPHHTSCQLPSHRGGGRLLRGSEVAVAHLAAQPLVGALQELHVLPKPKERKERMFEAGGGRMEKSGEKIKPGS